MTDLDVGKLIDMVRERRALWDSSVTEYTNRPFIRRCWKEIGATFCITEDRARKKWKYLRDRYVSELNKCQRSKGGNRQWTYFPALSFLQDYVAPRSSGTLTRPSSEVDTQSSSGLTAEPASPRVSQPSANCLPEVKLEEDIQLTGEHFGCEPDPLAVEENSLETEDRECEEAGRSFSPPVAAKRPRCDESVVGRLDHLVEKLARKIWQDSGDEDIMFLKSLIPHIRKIPTREKLKFRGKVQELVQEYAYSVKSCTGKCKN